MDENKFWLGVWAIIAVIVLGVGSILMQSSYENNRAIERALKAAPTADPIALSCALNIGSTSTCATYLLRK